MDTFRTVVELVAMISASALCIYLIVVLVRVRELLTVMQKDLGELGEKARPVLDNMNFITERLKSVSEKIDDQVGLVKGSIESVKMAADSLVSLEQRIQENIEEPVMRLSSILGAIVNRVAAFFGGAKAT
ncbi:MAG TPA: DUF948 domain-containing protein [Bacteroidota bacterium]